MTKSEATKHANELLEQVKDVLKGAEIEVWENLGWCFCVTSDYIKIHHNVKSNTYRTYISDRKDSSGALAMWDGDNLSDTPVGSICKALEIFHKFHHKMRMIERAVEDTVNYDSY